MYVIYFFSKAKHARKRKLNDLNEKLQESNKKLKKARDGIIEAKVRYLYINIVIMFA